MAEFDKDYVALHALWTKRRELKIRHPALGYMRHEKFKSEGGPKLPNDPASAAIYIRVEDHSVDAYVGLDQLRTLVDEWQSALIATTDQAPQAYTKDFIARLSCSARTMSQKAR